MPRLAVVVPATDRPATLERCLAAIERASDPPEQIAVVTDPIGLGPAAARNAGVRQTDAEIIVFVDSDVLVHADVFSRIRATFADDPRLVALVGSYDDRVATSGAVAGFRNLLHHVIHQRSAGELRSFWTGIGAARRSDFEAVGGFDADMSSIEDIELGGRLAERGRILLDPALRGTHLKEWTLVSMVQTDFARRGVPWVELLANRRKLPATLNLGVREKASAIAALGLARGTLRRKPVLAAASLTAGVALNRDLFSLLRERLGVRGAILGVGLHTLHQLTAVASVPVGLARAIRR